MRARPRRRGPESRAQPHEETPRCGALVRGPASQATTPAEDGLRDAQRSALPPRAQRPDAPPTPALPPRSRAGRPQSETSTGPCRHERPGSGPEQVATPRTEGRPLARRGTPLLWPAAGAANVGPGHRSAPPPGVSPPRLWLAATCVRQGSMGGAEATRRIRRRRAGRCAPGASLDELPASPAQRPHTRPGRTPGEEGGRGWRRRERRRLAQRR